VIAFADVRERKAHEPRTRASAGRRSELTAAHEDAKDKGAGFLVLQRLLSPKASKIPSAPNLIIVVRRSVPKDKPDLATLKDNAKLAFVAIEPKHSRMHASAMRLSWPARESRTKDVLPSD
jgi:hypothetical protein